MVSYVDGDEFYGTQAKAQLVRNARNTVGYWRDFLGCSFESIDPTHCHASAHPIAQESAVAFKIQVEGDSPSNLTVSEITTRYLKRLATAASDFSGKTITSAVITVPTNFSDKQKDALIKAARLADIEVLQLIHEPIAALLAYDARADAQVSDKIVVVADFGGTRSDVAVIASRGGMYTILATAHDYEFAGVHLDKVLVDHFAKEFIKWNSVDPREDARSLAKLKLEAESCKKALSIGTNASFSIESLAEGIDFASTINRLRYETIARRVFDGFARLVEGVIKKAKLDVLDVDEVILSGGTSHTPKIASLFQSIFPATATIVAPSTSAAAINPSELQARGAALQASLIQEFEVEDIEQSTHPAVTVVKHLSNAIGVLAISDDENKGVFIPVIAAETPVPVRRTIHIATPKEGGDVLVKVVEGGSHIKVSKPEPKPKSNGARVENANSDDSEDEDFEEEEDEKREKVWKVGKTLAEIMLKGLSKGSKVEVMVNVASDRAITVTSREVGGKGGVRAILPSPA